MFDRSKLAHSNDDAILVVEQIHEHLNLDCIGVVFEHVDTSHLLSLREVSESSHKLITRVLASVPRPVVLYMDLNKRESYIGLFREAERAYPRLRSLLDTGVRVRSLTTSVSFPCTSVFKSSRNSLKNSKMTLETQM